MQLSVIRSTLRTLLGVDSVRYEDTPANLHINQACEMLEEDFEAPWDEVFCTPKLTASQQRYGLTTADNLLFIDSLAAPSQNTEFACHANCHVRWTVTVEDTKVVDVFVRWTGVNDNVRISISTGRQVKIIQMVDGTPTTVDTGTTLTDATEYTLDVVAMESTIRVYLDGVLDASATITDHTTIAQGYVQHLLVSNDIALSSYCWSNLSPHIGDLRDISFILYINDDDAQKEIGQRLIAEMLAKHKINADAGDSSQWTLYGDELWFGVEPDSALQVYLFGTMKPWVMSADTDENKWAKNASRLVLYTAAVLATEFLLEDERLGVWERRRESEEIRLLSKIARRDANAHGGVALEPG